MKALKGVTFNTKNKKPKRATLVPIAIHKISPSSSKIASVDDILSQEIPKNIVASYTNDFNLLYIHDVIIRKLREEITKIEGLEKELNIELDLVKTPQTIVDRNQTKKRINSLKKEIDIIKSGIRLKEYLHISEPIIQKYEGMVPKRRKIDFTASKSKKLKDMEEEEKTPQYKEKMRIVQTYLDFAQDYINITIEYRKKNVNVCGCGCDLTDVHIDNFGTQVCPECQTERHIIGFNIYKSDTLASRNDYSDRGNFEKALMRYQGKQPDKIPDTLFVDLDIHFSSRGKPTSAEIKALPLTERGKKKGTNLDILYKALLDTGYSSFYEDAYLIAHRYWGWKLADVSHLESVIMEDYEKTQRVYNTLQKERSSSLGTQYRLFKHLEVRGHPCKISDFKIVKMLESLEYHDETWRTMCEQCGDPEIYFIPTI